MTNVRKAGGLAAGEGHFRVSQVLGVAFILTPTRLHSCW